MADWKGQNWFAKTGYSMAGLRDAILNEKAVREELAGVVIAVALGCWRFGFACWTKILLLFLISLIPVIVELINTAFELMIDLGFGTEYREEIRMAKDMLSAAVLLTLTVSYISCLLILFL